MDTDKTSPVEPGIAVIIVNWHSGELMRECLTHLQRQTRSPDRVLVYNNDGNDALEQAKSEFPFVEWLGDGTNVGFARANNLCAARLHDCEWVCLLNPDAFPEPDWLATLLRTARSQPQYDCLASLLLQQRDPDLIDSAGDEWRRNGIGLHRLQGRRTREAMNDLKSPRPVFAACGAAAMYRRRVFLECGGFDETLFAFYEDVDLGARLRLAGHETLLVPDAVVHHAGGGATGGPGNPLAAYYGQRNFILTYVKDMPGYLFWLYLPSHLWAIARGIGRGCLDGRPWLLLKATGAALLRLPYCLRARRRVQAARRVDLDRFRTCVSEGETWSA